MTKGPAREQRMRQLLAQEAAKIMVDEGHDDFYAAKKKAAQRLGAADTRNLPSNKDIEEALIAHQRLFGGDAQIDIINRLRKTALVVMERLAKFDPRLVGPVLTGTASVHSDIDLHLFAETPEDVMLFLVNNNISYDAKDFRLRGADGEITLVPGFQLSAEGIEVCLRVFPTRETRQAPRSPVDGKPMQRASIAILREILAR